MLAYINDIQQNTRWTEYTLLGLMIGLVVLPSQDEAWTIWFKLTTCNTRTYSMLVRAFEKNRCNA